MKLRSKKAKAQQTQRRRLPAGDDALIKTILVPIDFSEHSKNALQYAVSLGKQFHATLILEYVVEPTIYPADFSFGQVVLPSIEKELRERGQIELDQLAAKCAGGSLTTQTLVCTGKPYFEIVKTAVEKEADIIVMATHGHTGVEHLLFGGTAEKVIRKAPCPVLILRPEAEPERAEE